MSNVQLTLNLDDVAKRKHNKCSYHDGTCANRLASGYCSHRSMSPLPLPTEMPKCPWWRRKTLQEQDLQTRIKNGMLHHELNEERA
jgi:hypothetical protein